MRDNHKIHLFSKDNAGNVLSWEAKLILNKGLYDLQVCHGRFNGAMQFEWERQIEPKNVGKSNETTPLEQALSRLRSRANIKKRKGYVELSDEEYVAFMRTSPNNQEVYLRNIVPNVKTDLDGHVKPMLANHYFRSKKNWTDPTGKVWKDRKYYYLKNPHEEKEKGAIMPKFPCYGQPKINGVRATISMQEEEVIIKSRDGMRYDAVVHVKQWMLDIFNRVEEDIVFDGELFIYGESLQTIQGSVKSADLNTSRVVYIIYDLAIENFTNKERWEALKQMNEQGLIFGSVELIRTWVLKNDKQVQKFCDRFIKEGHEGIILRDMNATYNFGRRRNNMVKLKRTISEDFLITGVVPQPKTPNMALFVCKHLGNTFKVTPTFNNEVKEEILNHPSLYIGKKLQCSFYEWTDDMKPYHIIDTVVRDYE